MNIGQIGGKFHQVIDIFLPGYSDFLQLWRFTAMHGHRLFSFILGKISGERAELNRKSPNHGCRIYEHQLMRQFV